MKLPGIYRQTGQQRRLRYYFKGGNLRTERHEPTVMAVYGNP